MRIEHPCSICRTHPASLRAVPAELRLRELPEGTPVGVNEVVVRHAPEEDVFVCEPCFESNQAKFALAFDLESRAESIRHERGDA